jgi:hypothetical protein
MAYDLQVPLVVAGNASGASTGVKGNIGFMMPAVVHYVGIVNKGATAATGGVIVFKKRPTAGSTSGETIFATLTVPNPLAQGMVLYKVANATKFAAGDELVVEVTTSNANLTSFDAVAMVEHTHENLANFTDAVASA